MSVHRFPASDFAAARNRQRCTEARATILANIGNWPLMIDQAVILAENGDDADRAFSQAVMDDYTAHADKVALDDLVRGEWLKLTLAALVGVAAGLMIMGGL